MDEESEREFHDYVVARRAALEREAYLLVGDVHLAQDLVQTALARAYTSWRRVRASSAPDAYVRRILVNAHISRLRRRRVAEVLTDAPPDTAVSDPVQSVDIMRALAALPRRQRSAVVLRYWADLPEGEVAAAMGCSVGTVRSQSAKGLAKLRSLVGPRQIAARGAERDA